MSLSLMTDRELLRLRFKDLNLSFVPEKALERLHGELRARGIKHFRPHAWLSSEWFCADGVPGIAVPFYLAHPRLVALERAIMGRVEGGSPAELMRILRHEAGHAFLTAYGLRGRKDVEEVFGRFRAAYPRRYCFRPYSRRHVRHLGEGYAQSHPDEDFAETFAVWLAPRSGWRRRYRGWAALQKLRFMDRLIRDLGPTVPAVRNRRKVEPLSALSHTLGQHYRLRRAHFRIGSRPISLGKVFGARGPKAGPFLRKVRAEVRREVARESGQYQYVVDRVYGEILKHCEDLELKMRVAPRSARPALNRLVARETRKFVRAGHHLVAV